jgi:hypothetical protein
MSGKVYLGDSVYAEWEAGMVKRTTENGFGTSNTTWLEPEELEALARFVEAGRRAA